jgi:hypothetical protein
MPPIRHRLDSDIDAMIQAEHAMPRRIPITELRNLQSDAALSALNADTAEAIMQTEGKAYGLACIAGSRDNIEITRENLKLAIVRALDTASKPIDVQNYRDSCGND